MPILRREYSDSAPIKEHTSVGDFLDRYWLQKSAAAYLHQWQFPLSKTAVPKLCYRCDPPPCLDEDLLKHWLDICLGDNPLQYLFMGEASTSSKLHIDPGGLDLLIAPIIGEKQVTLVHRDDSELIMATVHDDDESDDDDAAATSPDGFDATHSSLTRETRLPPSRRARARARARRGSAASLQCHNVPVRSLLRLRTQSTRQNIFPGFEELAQSQAATRQYAEELAARHAARSGAADDSDTMAVALSDDDENSEEFVIEASDSPDGDSAAATDGGARPAEAEPALSRRLERHPMLAFARVWQHTLRPGEILLMPWGTFHAVRNLTATLSYHRFHLDRINLPAFYRSMVDCDAPGISHAEILWNASHGLMRVRTARAARRASHLDARARARALFFVVFLSR